MYLDNESFYGSLSCSNTMDFKGNSQDVIKVQTSVFNLRGFRNNRQSFIASNVFGQSDIIMNIVYFLLLSAVSVHTRYRRRATAHEPQTTSGVYG